MVRDKRLGIRTARDGVQHRRLYLQEVMGDHEFTHTTDSPAACRKARAGITVCDQINVTLAVFDLLISDPVKLIGQRAQALGQQPHAVGVDGQLPRAGFKQNTLSGDDVTEIPMFEGLVTVLAHTVVVEVDLDASARTAHGGVLQRRKTGLAHHTLEHHATRDAGTGGNRFEFLFGFVTKLIG